MVLPASMAVMPVLASELHNKHALRRDEHLAAEEQDGHMRRCVARSEKALGAGGQSIAPQQAADDIMQQRR